MVVCSVGGVCDIAVGMFPLVWLLLTHSRLCLLTWQDATVCFGLSWYIGITDYNWWALYLLMTLFIKHLSDDFAICCVPYLVLNLKTGCLPLPAWIMEVFMCSVLACNFQESCLQNSKWIINSVFKSDCNIWICLHFVTIHEPELGFEEFIFRDGDHKHAWMCVNSGIVRAAFLRFLINKEPCDIVGFGNPFWQ